MKTIPVIVQHTFNAPASKVWAALTHKKQIKEWYFDIPDFLAEYGATFNFYGDATHKHHLHHCKITDIVVEEKLSYSWKYEGVFGESHVTFELFREDDKTRLRLTHEGLESFPADRNDLSRANFEKGWDTIINTNLKAYLEKED